MLWTTQYNTKFHNGDSYGGDTKFINSVVKTTRLGGSTVTELRKGQSHQLSWQCIIIYLLFPTAATLFSAFQHNPLFVN